MQVFFAHVGDPGNIDIAYTVTRKRSLQEIIQGLKGLPDTPELAYFQTDPVLHTAFPHDTFNCWGTPSGAEPRFREMEIGDLVLIIPKIGIAS